MLDGPPDEVLAGACTWRPRVTSWLGGRLLAAEIPVSGGRITGDVGDDIIETLSITVPRAAAPAPGADVFDWRPESPDHPLAKFGQILDVTILVGSVVTGEVWEIRRGRFQIKDWDDDDDGTITVKAESLLARPRDDKLKQLSSPTGTLISEARRLLPGGMGASFDPELTDRPVPATMSWSKDRLKNLQEIADAWPALLRIDPWGQVYFRAPLPTVPVPVLTLRDGDGGTLISAPRSDTRTGVYNEVLTSTSSSDKADIQGYAAVTAGPMSVNGDYAVVTKEYSSSLLEDKAQLDAAAATILANSTRAALAIPARIVPDPRLELDDPVQVLRGARGRMETVEATYSDWVETRRNFNTNPKMYPTAAGWATKAPGALTSTPAGAQVDISSTGASAMIFDSANRPVAIGDEWSASLEVSVPVGFPALTVFLAIHHYGMGARIAESANVTILPGETVTIEAPSTRVSTSTTGIRTILYGSGVPAGARFVARHALRELALVPGAYIDGDTNPAGELERTRWIAGADASESVVETRTVLVPEHRIWVTESAEESADVDRQWGWVTAYDLPLTVSDGEMRVDVGLSS